MKRKGDKGDLWDILAPMKHAGAHSPFWNHEGQRSWGGKVIISVYTLSGMKLYRFMNTFFLIPACVVFSILALEGNDELTMKITLVIGIVLTFALLGWSYYLHAKREMLKWGHSEYCSRKIARPVMFYAGLWSDFKIMKDKES